MQLLFTGGNAAGYTSGFPNRLTYDVSFPTGPYTRLIPEMNFTCNGVITGYTAALRDQNGDRDPVIQSTGTYQRKLLAQLIRYSLDTGIRFSTYLLIFKSQKGSSEALNFRITTS